MRWREQHEGGVGTTNRTVQLLIFLGCYLQYQAWRLICVFSFNLTLSLYTPTDGDPLLSVHAIERVRKARSRGLREWRAARTQIVEGGGVWSPST